MTVRLELSEPVVDELVERIAVRAAAIVLERIGPEPSKTELMTVAEAAEYLRARPQRIYDLLSAGRLARRKDGSRVLVSRVELEAYVAGEPTGRRGPRVAQGSGNCVARRIAG